MLIPVIKAAYKAYSETEPSSPIGTPEFYEKVAISGILVLAGGVFAGSAVPFRHSNLSAYSWID